jgi:hypothetical protein
MMNYKVFLLLAITFFSYSCERRDLLNSKQITHEEKSLSQLLAKAGMSEEEFLSPASRKISGFDSSAKISAISFASYINVQTMKRIISSPAEHINIATKWIALIYYCDARNLLNTIDEYGKSPLLNCLQRAFLCEDHVEIKHVGIIAKVLESYGSVLFPNDVQDRRQIRMNVSPIIEELGQITKMQYRQAQWSRISGADRVIAGKKQKSNL